MKPSLPRIPLHIRAILLCFFFSFYILNVTAQTVDYGKSYVNITKGVNGGTIEPGDTLEIRATFVVKSSLTLDSCRYTDVIPTGTAYIPATIKVLTNEGKQYKAFTDAAGDDAGWLTGTLVTINMGYNATDAPATATRRGRIRYNHFPSFYGGTCIMVASYRVRVLSAFGSTINLGGGSFTYKNGAAATVVTTFPINRVAIFRNYGLCSNAVGANSLGTESNGTFGFGKPKNRGTSANVPATYTYATFSNNNPNDYYYGIANNTSASTYTTSNAWPKPDGGNRRVFTVWDIIGDHTGAASPTAGNPPADTVNSSTGGYALIVNASYRTDSAFQHTVTGLCPNTYYEFSAWFRNICSRCGCDSAGRGSGTTGYIPTAPGDSSGVYPNLTFEIDEVDYYSTGNMRYTGQWIKKGFVYLTGPTQTSFTATIRNNAPGGGGNDWAIDDIALATCTPNLNLLPSGNVNVCIGNQVDMSAVVRSYFPNYTSWRWERSTDGGVTWANTGISGTGSPTLVSGEYQYTVTYPSFLADSTQNMNRYRIRIGSTAGNLNSASCSFAAQTMIIVYVNNCMEVLKTDVTSFEGQNKSGLANLRWETTNETENTIYEIERSKDKLRFEKIGTVDGKAITGLGENYSFIDNQPLSGPTYYRIKVADGAVSKFTKTILLSSGKLSFDIRTLNNPFVNRIAFETIAPENGNIQVTLTDNFGRVIKSYKEHVFAGSNTLSINNLDNLASGTYVLRVQYGDKINVQKLVKLNK